MKNSEAILDENIKAQRSIRMRLDKIVIGTKQCRLFLCMPNLLTLPFQIMDQVTEKLKQVWDGRIK